MSKEEQKIFRRGFLFTGYKVANGVGIPVCNTTMRCKTSERDSMLKLMESMFDRVTWTEKNEEVYQNVPSNVERAIENFRKDEPMCEFFLGPVVCYC